MFWNTNVCRICSQNTETMYPIFDKLTNRNIEQKMKQCLKLNIQKDDSKPKEICGCCYMKLNEFADFMQLCYESNSKFESLLFPDVGEEWNERLQVNINTIPQIEEKVNENILSPDLSLLVKENIVNMQLIHDNPVTTEASFESVVNLNLSSNLRSGYSSTYRNVDDCQQNQSVLRHSSEFKSNYIQENNYANFNTCPNYNKSGFNLDKSKEYFYEKKLQQIDNINSEYQCITTARKNDHCVYSTEPCSFNQSKAFAFHSANQNVEEIKILDNVDSIIEFPKATCEDKPSNSNDPKKNLKTIQSTKSSRKPFPCSYCEKTFMRKENLKSHSAIHTKIRPFVCDVCSKSFVQRWDLTCHKRIHTNLYQCTFCDKTFSFKSKLERHVRTHTNDRPFVCAVRDCAKKFSDKRNLIAHNVTHEDDKKFTCDKCEKMFKTKKQLNQHSRVHSDCLAHKCDLCLKAYKYKTNLVMHLKKHNGYTCKICQQDFLKLSNLLKHKKDCKNKS